jgi:hypothetical protein
MKKPSFGLSIPPPSMKITKFAVFETKSSADNMYLVGVRFWSLDDDNYYEANIFPSAIQTAVTVVRRRLPTIGPISAFIEERGRFALARASLEKR